MRIVSILATTGLAGAVILAALAPAEEPPAAGEPVIRSITFAGRELFPEVSLLEVSGIRPGDPWLPGTGEAVVKRLAAWRYLASVGPPRISAAAGGGVDVIIPVRELRITGSVTFEGNDALLVATLLAASGLKKGDPLRENAVEEAEEAVVDRYQRDGFLLPEVHGETTPGAAGRMDIRFRIREGRRVHVREVRLEGAEQASEREALGELELQPRRLFGFISRGYYIPTQMEADLARLRAFYRKRGFLASEVGFGGLELNEKKTWASVTLMVREGPRYVLEAVRVEGHKLFPTKLLEREAAVRAGGFFAAEDLDEGLLRLIRWYEEHADIAPRIEVRLEYGEGNKVTAIYRILEEEHYLTGRVRIGGNEWTRDRVAHRAVPFIPGEHFRPTDLARTREKLLEQGLYDSVEVREEQGDVRQNGPRVRDVAIDVREKEHMGLFQVGGGASSGSGEVGYASVHHSNFDLFRLPAAWNDWRGAFVGGGQEIDVEVIPGTRESEYRFRFLEPYFFRSDLALSLGAATNIYDRRTYDESRVRGAAALQKFLDRDHRLSASIAYLADAVRIHDLDRDAPLDAIDVKGTTFLGYPRLELRYEDLVRSYYSGPRGSAASAKLDLADAITGSRVDFTRATLSVDFHRGFFDRRIDHQHVLHLGVDLSWMEGRGGDEVPLFERTYLGGPRTFPGFAYRRLGPREGKTPVGGEGAVYGAVDYSFPLFRPELRGFGVFEWGDIEPSFSKISTGSFRTAAGGGVMIRLKIGPQYLPATLYWVQALSSERGDREQLFSFTVGLGF